MNIPEILPCPFCGRADMRHLPDGQMAHPTFSGQRCVMDNTQHYTEDWNRRQTTPEAANLVRYIPNLLVCEAACKTILDGHVLEEFLKTLNQLRDAHAATFPAHPPKPEPTEARSERQRFEDWYTLTAFDLAANPIGSRDCHLQWTAWWQRALETQAPKPPAEWMEAAAKEINQEIANNTANYDFLADEELVTIIARHYSAPAGTA